MPPTPDEAPPDLRPLGDLLLQGSLRNSVRVLILISLGMNRALSFSELLELTGISKGSLGHHLEQLETAGLVRSRTVFTLGGPRVRVEISPGGLALYEELRRLLSGLGSASGPGVAGSGPATGLSQG